MVTLASQIRFHVQHSVFYLAVDCLIVLGMARDWMVE